MISGTLPEGRRKQFVFGATAMFALVGFVALVAVRPLLLHVPSQGKAALPAGLLLAGFLVVAVVSILQIRKRVITQFDYDGSLLYFQTMGRPEPQTLPMLELHKIDDWQTRGGSIGYVLVFRGGQKLNVDFRLANSGPLIAQLQRDRWPGSASTL